MTWRNLLRFIGVLALFALAPTIPLLFGKIVMAWLFKNIIVMIVLLAADVLIGIYLIYWIVRYVVIQVPRGYFTSS